MDTIVAISTALGAGAISIVRLSGPESIEIVNKCFKGKDLRKVESHTITYGYIYDNEKMIDEVLVSVFKAPKTYTCEDVVEINCHGGMFVTNKVLELMLENGARIAESGEFTKRAFLNGRIDLTRAEAVMDVINSQTDKTLKLANSGLRGDIYNLINGLRTELVNCIASIEVNIDYPEYEEENEVTNNVLKPVLNKLKIKLEDILEKANTSVIIREGIDTAIVGKPNVGKSSILNALIREKKAIVTSVAGTTRDIVEGKINIGGVLLGDVFVLQVPFLVVPLYGHTDGVVTILAVDFVDGLGQCLLLFTVDGIEQASLDGFVPTDVPCNDTRFLVPISGIVLPSVP